MKSPIDRRAPRQAGQALVEFLVCSMLATVVLFLAIAMLGKFNDVRNKTLMGSRYAAWERTVWLDGEAVSTSRNWLSNYGEGALRVQKSDRQIQREFLQRAIAAKGSPLADADRNADALPLAQQTMWSDYGGHALLADAQDVAVMTGDAEAGASPETSFGSMQSADGTPFAATLDLPTHTMQSGTLSVTIGRHNDALKRLWRGFNGITFSDTNVLLTNTWLPEGPTRARALFTHAVPAANAKLIEPSLYRALRQYAPEIDTLDFGRVREDVVPSDRLAP